MKQNFFNFKQAIRVAFLVFFSSSLLIAQTSPSTSSTLSIQTDAVYGPTLIIYLQQNVFTFCLV